MMGVLWAVLVILVVVAATAIWLYSQLGPDAPTTCPNCRSEKTYRRTSSQALSSISTGGPKGQRQQVIETFSCSTCGHVVTKNRLVLTQSGES